MSYFGFDYYCLKIQIIYTLVTTKIKCSKGDLYLSSPHIIMPLQVVEIYRSHDPFEHPFIHLKRDT